MSTITVQLDQAAALAEELALLAAQLADEEPGCRAAGDRLRAALGGEVGACAGSAAAEWAQVTGLLAERCAATGRTLGAAIAAYREADAVLAGGLARAHPGWGPR